MTLDALRSSTSTAQTAAQVDSENSSAFREADFMAIMLAELSNQDPFEPAETAKLVENAQKLQELSNTRFERYRNDLRWAQDLIGKGSYGLAKCPLRDRGSGASRPRPQPGCRLRHCRRQGNELSHHRRECVD